MHHNHVFEMQNFDNNSQRAWDANAKYNKLVKDFQR